MTRPRRWCWWGKWTALALAVVVAMVWHASGWWDASLEGPCGTARLTLGLGPGAVHFQRIDGMSSSQWTWDGLRRPAPSLGWGFEYGRAHFRGVSPFESLWISVPLWAPFLLFSASAVWLWRLDRKPKPGHCPRCRYDLSATPPAAPCPECGRLATKT